MASIAAVFAIVDGIVRVLGDFWLKLQRFRVYAGE